MATMDDF
jgi:hypothetical protein